MPNGDDVTPVKLKNGQVINLKGKNLGLDDIKTGVAKYYASQSSSSSGSKMNVEAPSERTYPSMEAAIKGSIARTKEPSYPEQLKGSKEYIANKLPGIGGSVGLGLGTLLGAPNVGAGVGTAVGKLAEPVLTGGKPSYTGAALEGAGTYAGGKGLEYGIGKLLGPWLAEKADKTGWIEDIFRGAPSKDPGYRDAIQIAKHDLQDIAKKANFDWGKLEGGRVTPDMRSRAVLNELNKHMSDMYQLHREAQTGLADRLGASVKLNLNNAIKEGVELLDKHLADTPDNLPVKATLQKILGGQDPTTSEANVLIKKLNEQLPSYKDMTGQVASKTRDLWSYLDRTLTKETDNALTDIGFPGIKDSMKRYSALSDVREGLQKIVNEAEKERIDLRPRSFFNPMSGRAGAYASLKPSGIPYGKYIQRAMEDLADLEDFPGDKYAATWKGRFAGRGGPTVTSQSNLPSGPTPGGLPRGPIQQPPSGGMPSAQLGPGRTINAPTSMTGSGAAYQGTSVTPGTSASLAENITSQGVQPQGTQGGPGAGGAGTVTPPPSPAPKGLGPGPSELKTPSVETKTPEIETKTETSSSTKKTPKTIEQKRTEARERMAKGRAEAARSQSPDKRVGGKPLPDVKQLMTYGVPELEETAAQFDKRGVVVKTLKALDRTGQLKKQGLTYEDALKGFIQNNLDKPN